MKDIHIIGAGINGLCSAYFLNENGKSVCIIDQDLEKEGSSFGNAGMIVPSHFVPLASPGMVAKGLKYMFSGSSPFYIKPSFNYQLWKWMYEFYKHSNKRHVNKSAELIWQLNESSKLLYRDIVQREKFEVDFEEQGLMSIYKTPKARDAEKSIAKIAKKIGLRLEQLDAQEVNRKQQGIGVKALGAIFYPDDAHIHSNAFTRSMRRLLKERGVEFKEAKVLGFEYEKDNIKSIRSENEIIDVSELLICAGSWTARLLRKMQIPFLIQDGKGYSITLENANPNLRIPSILSEDHVAMTPMGNRLRITCVLEISNISPKISYPRLQSSLASVSKYFPEIHPSLNPPDKDIWIGYRPLSPDGLPYIGSLYGFENLYINTGQGMMGMSLGPISGKLISEEILQGHKSIETDKLNPGRFS